MDTQITEALARKVLTTIDAGLTKGVGESKPGSMCVMAAINYAFGHAHGDRPSCVGHAVRAFDIAINDAAWSSDEARANGMRREAIAKLGSNRIDQVAFASYVALHTIKRILPITLRAMNLLEEALRCEQTTTIAEAQAAAWSAWSAARWAAESAESAAAWSAWSAAESAAWSAWSAAESAAAWSAESAESAAWSAESAESAAWSAESAESAESAARWAAESAESARDSIYVLACEIAAEALIECKSEGAKWLWLCDEVTV